MKESGSVQIITDPESRSGRPLNLTDQEHCEKQIVTDPENCEKQIKYYGCELVTAFLMKIVMVTTCVWNMEYFYANDLFCAAPLQQGCQGRS
jgi:hypothetical protein